MRFILYKQWDQLPCSAHALFLKGEQKSLFLSRIWLENITTHALAENQSILLACVEENDSLLAILPMIKTSQGRHSKQSSLSSLSTKFTSLYSLLISDSNKEAILTCLADGLANSLTTNQAQTPTASILFEPIDTNDDDIIRLRQLMESCGFQSHSYFRFYNWTHTLKGQSFDQYMAERPTHLRNTIKRKQRKLEREHNYEIRLYKEDNINQALIDYDIIYTASWKTNEFFSDFTPALVKNLSRLSWLRLAILYINEQPAAAQIWFVLHAKANIYRLVFNEQWKSYSPGSILTEFLMRHVIDIDKVTEIDFLTGNENYKQDWMTIRRERFGIRFAKQAEQNNFFSRTIQLLKNQLSCN